MRTCRGLAVEFVVIGEDDGSGRDFGALRAKGETLGVKPEEGRESELILIDGLTTKEAADDFAGHGVGLGAVRDELRQVGYAIEVESRSGRGTKFTLRRAQGLIEAQFRCAGPDDGDRDRTFAT